MNYAAFRDLAVGEDEPGRRNSRRENVLQSALPDVFSPASVIPAVYLFQSYFDSTLLENAILEQNPADAIVASTLKTSQASGYSLGLHPSSQTPITVQFGVGNSPASGSFVLKPGQIIRPYGKPGDKASQFSGFSYGLPTGWLGGGLATLVVFHTPDARVDWQDHNEVLFHRVRIPIIPLVDVTVAANNNARRNWPMRFPWPQAFQGANAVVQASNPVIAIARPSRVLAVLRGVATLADAYDTRFVYQATNDFNLNSAGTVVNTGAEFEDVTWEAFAAIGTSGNLFTASQFPIVELSGPITRLAADNGGLAIIDASGAAAFASGFIDFCRYGQL